MYFTTLTHTHTHTHIHTRDESALILVIALHCSKESLVTLPPPWDVSKTICVAFVLPTTDSYRVKHVSLRGSGLHGGDDKTMGGEIT